MPLNIEESYVYNNSMNHLPPVWWSTFRYISLIPVDIEVMIFFYCVRAFYYVLYINQVLPIICTGMILHRNNFLIVHEIDTLSESNMLQGC